MSDDRDSDERSAFRRMLLYGFLPVWFVPAVLDWDLHRKTKIEDTCGPRESLMHLLMFGCVGVPVTLALIFELDEFILASSVCATLTHEALTIYDVAYATKRRYTGPTEQHIHSFLEVLPFAGTFVLFGMHPQAARRLRDRPWRALVPRFAPKRTPIPAAYLTAFFAAIAAFIVAPYTEEFVRCYRAYPSLGERPVV